jgi:hypothetical protein
MEVRRVISEELAMKSEATSVSEYLASLPADRRKEVEAVREVILANIDSTYEEGILYGTIGYFVPLKVYPAGYNNNPKQPLGLIGIASQKNYLSLYLGGTYCGCGEGLDGAETPDMKWFRQTWEKTGKKLSMGKACIRFKKASELALDVIGEAVRRLPVRDFVAHYEGVALARAAR